MADFLDTLAQDAQATIRDGYYAAAFEGTHTSRSLTKAILACTHAPVITEIKFASPSRGRIREDSEVERIASRLQKGGAVAISILTEPKHFEGSLSTFIRVRAQVDLPLLMKDILLTRAQVDAATTIGADAILLIYALFERGYGEGEAEDLIDYAHAKDLEVLLETHTEAEFASALDTEADLVGINNRDLRTFAVDLNTTPRILQTMSSTGKVVVSESGIKTPADIRFLHASGAQAFLVGSAIMDVDDVEGKVQELVMAF
ncbi:MAG: indole-3-glycerol-phosphate synthase [Candidatus Bathyarchaeota archaeon]|nr:indole-3-glycerol-phosphate synthase [Candidatus Bathyarchaeota archaeon]